MVDDADMPLSENDMARAESDRAPELSAESKRTLLHLARQALHDYLSKGEPPGFQTDSPALLERRAAFVTLRRRDSGELRGCRGEYEAWRPLIESVSTMAIAAAIDDPRFEPVSVDEVPDLEIEISALTPLRPIRPDEIVIGRHGLRIVKGRSSALLLPQVPARFGWSREDFLKGLCWKARLPDDAWQAEDARLYAFETEVWSEEEG